MSDIYTDAAGNTFDYSKFDSLYTDDNGEKHPCYWNDTMPGKGGYVGIVYLDRPAPDQDSIVRFEFVELDRVELI